MILWKNVENYHKNISIFILISTPIVPQFYPILRIASVRRFSLNTFEHPKNFVVGIPENFAVKIWVYFEEMTPYDTGRIADGIASRRALVYTVCPPLPVRI